MIKRNSGVLVDNRVFGDLQLTIINIKCTIKNIKCKIKNIKCTKCVWTGFQFEF